jgi:hypothetical protein
MKKLLLLMLVLVFAKSSYGQTNCKNASIGQISVLMDLSEPLDQPTLIAYTTLSIKIVRALPSGGVLNLYSIKPNAEDVAKKPDYEFCIPDFNSMKGDKYRERARLKFENEVLPAMEKLGSSISQAKKSPILENIFKISHSTFLKNLSNESNSLIVISDFVQFSEIVDFYKDVPTYQSLSTNQKINTWFPKVGNVKMHLILLNNSSSVRVDPKKIRSFWLDYARQNFKQCGFSGINEASVGFKNDC